MSETIVENKNLPARKKPGRIFHGNIILNVRRIEDIIRKKVPKKTRIQKRFPYLVASILQTVTEEFSKEVRNQHENTHVKKICVNPEYAYAIIKNSKSFSRMDAGSPIFEVKKRKSAGGRKTHKVIG